MIVLGVPTTGAIPTKVVGAIDTLLLNRPGVLPYYVEGSLVYDARHKIVHYANEKGADLLFLDSDIQFDLKAFDSLVGHNTDIVSGLYYSRTGKPEPVAYKTVIPAGLFRKATIERITDIQPYSEVAAVGLGFCLIRNNVIRAIERPGKNPFEPFGNLGEDFSFLYRCRKKGFKVMLDTTFDLYHLGEYGYSRKDR